MGFDDISARLKELRNREQQKSTAKPAFDAAESYRLRGKMLGVLIRDARLGAARTTGDCAHLLTVTEETIEAWEYGDTVPSLPQLEMLAYYLNVPVSHFWGQSTLQQAAHPQKPSDYLLIRDRILGAMLRQSREEAGLSLDQISAQSQISVEQLEAYELGQQPIPMNELTVLAGLMSRNVSYFQESSSYIGELLHTREDCQKFAELDDDVRDFVANPVNLGFIRIAMMFSKMPAAELRRIAEGMLEITM